MYTPSDTRLEWLGDGLLFHLNSNKCLRAKMRPKFESFPGPLLKSGVGPLARYGNHREIVSRRLEQMYTSSYTRLKWPGEGSLFESGTNKRQGAKTGALFRVTSQAIIEVRPAAFVQIWHPPDHKWETWTGVSSI